jgi:hypothetical protein
MEGPPEPPRERREWGPPPDSDLIGIPLVVGMIAAILVVVAAFVFIGVGAGIAALVLGLVLALAISYRIVSDADVED